nr:hypothetical protein [Burkholderiales bacterium]
MKRLWSPSGFHAEKMTVRTRVPWYWRGIAIAVISVLAVALIGWFFNTGQKNAGFDRQSFTRQLDEASAIGQRMSQENVQLKASMEVFQRQAQIDKAAQRELSKSIHQLQEENAHLQEEVNFLRSIMSPGKAKEGLSVQNFRIEQDALPNEYRFQVLLVQGGRRERDFVGKAQLTVSLLKN